MIADRCGLIKVDTFEDVYLRFPDKKKKILRIFKRVR